MVAYYLYVKVKVHVFAQNIVHVIASTFYWFEAGQKLKVRSNSFYRTDNANCVDLFGSIAIDRDRTTLFTTDNMPKECMNERILLIHVFTDPSLHIIMVERFAVVDVAG